MNPIEPRAQATLDAAMNLIRTAACVGGDARGATTSAHAAQTATKISERDQLAATQAELRRNLGSVPERVLRSAAREGRQGRRAARRPEEEARVGRLADAQPRRREGGRGADELRAPRPDDLARVRMAAARPRGLHGRAARLQQRRRRSQSAARRDRRRRAAHAASRRSRASARAARILAREHRPGGRPGDARVLRRDPAPAPGARRPVRCT